MLVGASVEPRRAAPATDAGERYFQIGVVPVSVGGSYAPAIGDFAALYAEQECQRPPTGCIDVRVNPSARAAALPRRYDVAAGGTDRFHALRSSSVLPHIEWAINWELATSWPGYLAVHAGVVERNGRAALFAAPPQHGKSTLTLGLVRRGWRYLSDEFALLEPSSGHVHPYPKAICVKEGSFTVLNELGLSGGARRFYDKGKKGRVTFVRPSDCHEGAQGGVCPIGSVFFCRYEPGAVPRMTAVSRADAVLRLTRVTFNFRKYRARGVELLADVVRNAECYELTSGDLSRTCDLVASVVG
ncbi:MAG: hypothetical protein HOP29_18170 [Phycisphaerales bacterium]|nr:hypothetical protein [Phycisphaerales bacterium]